MQRRFVDVFWILVCSVCPYPIISSFVGSGSHGSMGVGISSGFGESGQYLPPGYAMIDGELVDMSNKLVQRVGGAGTGTQYFSFTNQRGPPTFRRREIDTGRRFIVFPDRNYMPGDGHYVVLRRFKRSGIGLRGGNIYEAFYLDLGDSINAMVTNFNSLSPVVNFAGIGGHRGMVGGGLRMKRKIPPAEQDDEILFLRKRKNRISDLESEETEKNENITSVTTIKILNTSKETTAISILD